MDKGTTQDKSIDEAVALSAFSFSGGPDKTTILALMDGLNYPIYTNRERNG